jgi:hypothetical protein
VFGRHELGLVDILICVEVDWLLAELELHASVAFLRSVSIIQSLSDGHRTAVSGLLR